MFHHRLNTNIWIRCLSMFTRFAIVIGAAYYPMGYTNQVENARIFNCEQWDASFAPWRFQYFFLDLSESGVVVFMIEICIAGEASAMCAGRKMMKKKSLTSLWLGGGMHKRLKCRNFRFTASERVSREKSRTRASCRLHIKRAPKLLIFLRFVLIHMRQ